uniref:Uncharacterized protein n=1 Tax=Panagrolaimus davidi TaxID=227884 RepID=A0A914PHK6_9BILA
MFYAYTYDIKTNKTTPTDGGNHNGVVETINCTACAFYHCINLSGFNRGYGCPDLAFKKCSNFKDEIDFIKQTNEENMDYTNGKFTYVSGCGDQMEGTECLMDKTENFNPYIEDVKKNGSKIHWYAPPNDKKPVSKNDQNGKSDSGSNNKNGALNLVAMLGFGWIIFAA